jgi:hypothetical protein
MWKKKGRLNTFHTFVVSKFYFLSYEFSLYKRLFKKKRKRKKEGVLVIGGRTTPRVTGWFGHPHVTQKGGSANLTIFFLFFFKALK